MFTSLPVNGKYMGLVALDQLGCRKTHGNFAGLGMIFDEMAERVNRLMHRPGAKIQPPGQPLFLARGDGRRDEIFDALVFAGRDGNARDAQLGRKLAEIDAAVIGADFVHHIQRQHHGNIQLQKLECQIEIALDIRRVDDIDDGIRVLMQQEVPGMVMSQSLQPGTEVRQGSYIHIELR